LLLKNEFPRINRLSFESLEVLRRLRYRHRLVQMRSRMRNSLQALALGSGIVLKSKLRTKRGRAKLNDLPLSPVLSQQRSGWLEMIMEVERRIAEVEEELMKAAGGDERICRLRTHPGIGLLTGLAMVHTLCPVDRFADTRKVTAYVGLEPREFSSGERKRMGHISKAGPRVLRFLLVEAGREGALVGAAAVLARQPVERHLYRPRLGLTESFQGERLAVSFPSHPAASSLRR
jgi:transposase